MEANIRLLLADDHALVLDGLTAMLSQEPVFEIVAVARDGREAVQKLKEISVDIALLDIDMPHLSGLEAARYIYANITGVRVVLLSMHAEPSLVRNAIEAGADGYVLKTADFDELSFALRQVAKGKPYFDTNLLLTQKTDDKPGASIPVAGLRDLTSREMEILRMIALGHSNNDIAERLFISPKTVDTHRTNLMRKLSAHNAASLTRIALEAGLV
jgi:DNA-binding NarL/FixJ family response regulator